MKIVYILSLCLFLIISCESTTENEPVFPDVISIDTVISFTPGSGQNAGQSQEYYPSNIFGLPSEIGSDIIQENSPDEILSIGLDGEIIVSFKDYSIMDAEGYDFMIFENVFQNPVTKINFIEPAIVSVSIDGIEYKEFPYDTVHYVGCAGTSPTTRTNSILDEWGGDRFDLSDLGIEEIKYIKIKDISKRILNNPDSPYYDVIISGFDLDAVVGVNYVKD